MSEIQRLIADIDSFLRHTGVNESTFGRRAVNDGKFVARLRSGRDCTLTTAERVRAFIRDYRLPPVPASKKDTPPPSGGPRDACL